MENSTAIRVKNSFLIEDILSRPDNSSESQRRLERQNPFQNNHVLFYGSSVNHLQTVHGINSTSVVKSDVKDTESHDVDVTDNEDHETMSEIASDDGNSSVHSECL